MRLDLRLVLWLLSGVGISFLVYVLALLADEQSRRKRQKAALVLGVSMAAAAAAAFIVQVARSIW